MGIQETARLIDADWNLTRVFNLIYQQEPTKVEVIQKKKTTAKNSICMSKLGTFGLEANQNLMTTRRVMLFGTYGVPA